MKLYISIIIILVVLAVILVSCSKSRSTQNNSFSFPYGITPIKSEDGKVFNSMGGYIHNQATNRKFKSEFIISVPAELFWEVFEKHINLVLPDSAYFILEKLEPEREIFLGDFVEEKLLMEKIGKYKEQLYHDSNIEFGIAWYDEEHMEKIYCNKFGTIDILTSKTEVVRAYLKDLALEENKNLDLPENYPSMSLNLKAAVKLRGAPEKFKSDEFETENSVKNLVRALELELQ